MPVLWGRKDSSIRWFINCMANPLYTASDHCLALFLCLVDQLWICAVRQWLPCVFLLILLTSLHVTRLPRHSLVGCNPTFAKNGRSGASPVPGFVMLQKYCSPIRLQYFKFSRRSGYMHYANYYITYTSIHNYYITVQNKSRYRACTRPSVFREGWVTPD